MTQLEGRNKHTWLGLTFHQSLLAARPLQKTCRLVQSYQHQMQPVSCPNRKEGFARRNYLAVLREGNIEVQRLVSCNQSVGGLLTKIPHYEVDNECINDNTKSEGRMSGV